MTIRPSCIRCRTPYWICNPWRRWALPLHCTGYSTPLRLSILRTIRSFSRECTTSRFVSFTERLVSFIVALIPLFAQAMVAGWPRPQLVQPYYGTTGLADSDLGEASLQGVAGVLDPYLHGYGPEPALVPQVCPTEHAQW